MTQIQKLMPEIAKVYPQMDEVRKETNACLAHVTHSNDRFNALQDQLTRLEQDQYTLTGRITQLRERDVHDLRMRMESSENITTDLAVQSHK